MKGTSTSVGKLSPSSTIPSETSRGPPRRFPDSRAEAKEPAYCMPLCPERCPDLDVKEEELPSLQWSCWSENHLAVLAVPGRGVQYCTALLVAPLNSTTTPAWTM